jgi:hypothetical protein
LARATSLRAARVSLPSPSSSSMQAWRYSRWSPVLRFCRLASAKANF